MLAQKFGRYRKHLPCHFPSYIAHILSFKVIPKRRSYMGCEVMELMHETVEKLGG